MLARLYSIVQYCPESVDVHFGMVNNINKLPCLFLSYLFLDKELQKFICLFPIAQDGIKKLT